MEIFTQAIVLTIYTYGLVSPIRETFLVSFKIFKSRIRPLALHPMLAL